MDGNGLIIITTLKRNQVNKTPLARTSRKNASSYGGEKGLHETSSGRRYVDRPSTDGEMKCRKHVKSARTQRTVRRSHTSPHTGRAMLLS